MINSVRLRNFKCFEDQAIPFRPLTFLSGLNGMGKSSLIQSLLLLRQSQQQGLLEKVGLALTGEMVKIGTAQDALYEGAREDEIEFDLDFTAGKCRWAFKYGNPEANVIPLVKSACAEGYAQTSLFSDNFQYLQAERTGPRVAFRMSDFHVRQHHQLGIRGEYAVHFLYTFRDSNVSDIGVAHPRAESGSLLNQVEAWLGEITPGTRLNFAAHPGTEMVSLEYSFVSGKQVSNPYRSTNVGFGITFVLPLIVALLASPPSSLIILENPEAHLHPRGQVQIGSLIARAVGMDRQVVLETHSDHILNGIRQAVHSGVASHDTIALHYFQKEAGQLKTELISPRLDADGRIDVWPDGFFDDVAKSLESLIEPRKQ